MPYPPLPRDPSADALEKQLLATWKHERLFARVQDATRYGPPFVFFEGPPTANGRPGIHHVFARTIKDLVCRYHTMLGQGVTRIAGWDTHGLPVEIEVERQLQISGKKQIEAYGVEKFNRLCRESVFTYKTDWEALSDRIAYWLDYEHPYITYTNDYIETVWWLLRRLHDSGFLYRGHKVLPYCPRCGTALSSHELALGYDQEQTNSVYVTFPLADDPQGQLVVWTTTPWTLLSNVAVAVHPDLEYGEYALDDAHGDAAALHRRRGARLGRARARASRSPTATLVRTFPGRGARGAALPAAARRGGAARRRGSSELVVAAEFVSAEDGSGLVHMAPAFGADDYAAGAAARARVREPGRARRHVPGHGLAGDRGQAGHRQGDQPHDHRAAQARRAAGSRRARSRTPIRSAGAATRRSSTTRAARGSSARRRSSSVCSRRTRRCNGTRPRSARAASASGSRTTWTGRSRATATGARRSTCGSATASGSIAR